MIKIKGIAEVKSYLNQLGEWVQTEVPMLTEEQAKNGKRYASGIAPNQTGALISAIGVRKGKDKEYAIVARTPKGKNNPRQVPYQVYLHYGQRGSYTGTKKSGDHQFMNTTYDYILNRYPQRMEQELDRQLNK